MYNISMNEQNNKAGRPRLYKEDTSKVTMRLPNSILNWLDGLAENRTKALIMLHNLFKGVKNEKH